MTMANQNQPPAWVVTGQTESVQVPPTGAPVNGIKVFFQTRAGHAGSVFVPNATYNAANVAAAVAAQAALMDEVGQLSG